MNSRLVTGMVCLVAATILAGKLQAGDKYPKTWPVRIFCTKPVLTSVEGYAEEQTKGDIAIRCVPAPFVEKVVYHKTLKEKPKGLLSLQSGNTVKYLVTEEPVAYSFEPARLTFKLRFANNTSHVLRFTDCLVSLLIDNQQIDIDKEAEAQLRKSVLLPHGTSELTVLGPKAQTDRVGDTTKTIFDTAKVIMFSIYDVTIEVDEANNPTKKATFEWIFENKPTIVSSDLRAVTTEESMQPMEAQQVHDKWYYK